MKKMLSILLAALLAAGACGAAFAAGGDEIGRAHV